MFTEDQKSALSAKLHPDAVKPRQQAGRTLHYIEGWHAIAEANRIFGFDGWHRETVEIKLASEAERKIGKDQRPGWGVSYICRCRVRVGDIVREGTGAGHGIDVDRGLAHESAIKEAETDAMKRALMTFGNQFGLALYDKERANVGVDDPEPEPEQHGRKSSAEGKRDGTVKQFNAIKFEFEHATDYEALKQLGQQRAAEIATMPRAWAETLREAWEVRASSLRARAA